MEFKVGDIVKGKKESDKRYCITTSDVTKASVISINVYDDTELIKIKVLEHKSRPDSIGVSFVVARKYFELVEQKQEPIVIYRKGNETIALDKETGKKAVAKCSPDDTYDFYTGARLAFDRLVKQPVKEVKRVAKAGEYVKIVRISEDTIDTDVKIGDILLIKKVDDVLNRSWAYYGKYAGQFLYEEEYVVLEGYMPEETEKKEPKKQLYNGKVVCIKTKFPNLTEGKIYEVVDGVLTYDDGAMSGTYFSFKDLQLGFVSSFIEIVE